MPIDFRSPILQSDVSGVAVHWTSYQHISGLSGHGGLDFPMPDGTPIRASAEGKIIRSFDHSQFGNLVVIDHGDQIHTLYAHMKNDGFVDTSGNLLNNASLSDEGKIVVNGQEITGAKSIKDYLSVNYDDDVTNDVEINVNAGDVIGFVGDTGIGDTHLHFSILELSETQVQSLGKKDGDPFGVFELPNSLIPWKDIDSDGNGTTRSDADYTNNRLAQYNAVLDLAPEIAALADHPNEVTNWEGSWDEGFTTFATLKPTDSSPGTALGSIERNGDKDWFRLETADEHTYEIKVSGTSVNGFQSLSDPFFTVKKLNETTGTYENIPGAESDRTDMSGASETLKFTADGGDYYVVIGGGGDDFATERGGYSVVVSDKTNAADPTFPENGVDETISFAEAAADLGVFDGSEVAELFLESLGAIVDEVVYTGSETAAFLVSEFEIPNTAIDYQGGILLSSGGFPGDSNTSSFFTVVHNTPGDDELNDVAQQAFAGAGQTNDASVLEFRLFVDDPSQLSFDLVFGSDEYPEYANSSFVDVAAVFVNGENVARFPGSDEPLSITNDNVFNNLVDNRNGVFATEWDGFAALGITANLEAGWNDIKVGVADTGDSRLDTAIYLADFELDLKEAGDGTAGSAKVIVSGTGELAATQTAEVFTFEDNSSSSAGSNAISGSASALNFDTVTNFAVGNAIKIVQPLQITLLQQAADLLQKLINLKKGSAIVEIDEDLDGSVDSVLTLEGEFENSRFMAEIVEDDVVLTLEELNLVEGTDGRDSLRGTDSADAIRSLGGSYDRLFGGDGADQFIFGAETSNGSRERDVIMDYEVGIDAIVLEDGASVDQIRESRGQVIVYLEDDRDAIYVRGDDVTTENLSIFNEDVFQLV